VLVLAGAKGVGGGEEALLGEAGKEVALALVAGTREVQHAEIAESVIAAGRRLLASRWSQAGAGNEDRRHRLLLDLQAYTEVQEVLELLKDSCGPGVCALSPLHTQFAIAFKPTLV
jgi:hypothetical protein